MIKCRILLNKLLPMDSIVRYPEKSQIEDIPINYWINCVQLTNYIRKIIFSVKNYLQINAEYINILKDSELFKQHVLQCHSIMCRGLNGTSIYWGIGGSNIKNGYLSKLRRTNILAEAQIPAEAFTYVQKIAKSFRDPLENAFTTNQYYVAFMRLENISEPYLEREGIKAIRMYNHKISVPKSSVPIAYMKKGDQICHYFYPSYEYIPKYLEVMRINLMNIFSNDKVSGDSLFDNLSQFYLAGIRSQAVKKVWNSVLHVYMNEIQYTFGYERSSHGMDDAFAFLLQPETFKNYYKDKYMRKGERIYYPMALSSKG